MNLYVWLFVIVGWVFFRSNDLSYAWNFLKVMFTGNSQVPMTSFYAATEFLTYSNLWIATIGILCAYPIFSEKYKQFRYSKIEMFLIFLLFVVAYVFAMTSTFSPFIYFRF